MKMNEEITKLIKENKVEILGASKTRTLDEIYNLYNEGITIFGENYTQELKEKYVDNQKSALEGTDCIREGIVIKTLDGTKRLKIVADKFQEVKGIKNTSTKSPYNFIDKYIRNTIRSYDYGR